MCPSESLRRGDNEAIQERLKQSSDEDEDQDPALLGDFLWAVLPPPLRAQHLADMPMSPTVKEALSGFAEAFLQVVQLLGEGVIPSTRDTNLKANSLEQGGGLPHVVNVLFDAASDQVKPGQSLHELIAKFGTEAEMFGISPDYNRLSVFHNDHEFGFVRKRCSWLISRLNSSFGGAHN